MIKFVSFALEKRVSAMLCGSIAVLLASCGGGTGEAKLSTPAGQDPQFAAVTYNGTTAPADIYVSTTGSDSNSGTQSAPFKTILKASQVATPGVTIRVAAGVYAGGFKTVANGTAEAKIRYLSTTKRGAKIVPPATSANSTAWDNRGSYVSIEDFEVDGRNIQSGTKWLDGIYTGGSYSTIKGNYVHHIAKTVACTDSGGGIGSDSYYKGVNNDVLANTVHDIGPTGCTYFLGIYINTAGGKVNNNLVYNISDAGIRLARDANRVYVSNNTVFNTNTGVRVSGGNGYNGGVTNDYTRVTNNILFDNTRYGVEETGSTGTHNVYGYNLIYKNGSYGWRLQNGLGVIATISADPQFVNYIRTGGGDYHLNSTSPAIDKAMPADSPSTDIDGNPRNSTTGYDIGAYQYTGTTTAPAPAPAPEPAPAPAPAPEPAPAPVESYPLTPATTYHYYVSPTGSDSNPGTASAPFKTILRASSFAKPSTTVHVAAGTYPGGFTTTVSGTSSARIYYVSTTKWGARIVPPASSSNSTAWDNRGSYVDIVGFEVDGTTAQSGTTWLNGIYNGGSYDAIRNNHVHHIAKTAVCTSAGGSAIGVDSYYGGVKSDVLANLVHDIGPAGCSFIQGIYISTSGTVKNNVVYRIAEAAIHLWHDANNVIITNNTVSASNTGIIVGGGDFYNTSAGDDYTAVYNNIVYDNRYGISEQGVTGTHNTYRNNLVYQNSTYNWSLKNGLTHSGTVSAPPQFVSYTRTGTPDLHLNSTSPAIGAGTSTYAPATDFDGKSRTATAGYDIGAFEY